MKNSFLLLPGLLALAVLSATFLVSCSERPSLSLGEECSLNTDCASPLGCRLGACRRLCVESRDCGAGYRCLVPTGETSGACQLPQEARCALNTDCPAGFSCIFGTCTLACVEDTDCTVRGSICVEEEPLGSGIYGCREPLDESCIYDSDCPERFSCAFDGSCQLECLEDGSSRDCPNPRVCQANICELP